jgi:hypothetical protein
MRPMALTLLVLGGCSPGGRGPAPRYHLVEKGPYQALYAPDGRLERLLHDQDGDRRAEAVIFYGASGVPLRAELDTDGDHRVDRWESFDERGRLVRVDFSPPPPR